MYCIIVSMMYMYDEDQKLIYFLIKTSLRKHNTPCYGRDRIQFFSFLIYLLCLSQKFHIFTKSFS